MPGAHEGCASTFFHHIFPVPPSQTCTTISAMIPESAASETVPVSRDAPMNPPTKTQLFDKQAKRQLHPRKTAKLWNPAAKSQFLNILRVSPLVIIF